MYHRHQNHALKVIFLTITILVFAFLFASPLAAQQPGRADTMSAMDRARMRQMRRNEQMETGILIGTVERESRRRPDENRPRLDYVQIKQDFERIQTVNNRMMETTFANNVLDYKQIVEASSEIRKRASRLKSGLPLLEAEDEQPVAQQPLKGWNELDKGEVKPALKALDDLIMGFVNNPVFQQPEIVDMQQSSKALRDLDAIIKLSTKIKKSAEKLIKTTAKQS